MRFFLADYDSLIISICCGCNLYLHRIRSRQFLQIGKLNKLRLCSFLLKFCRLYWLILYAFHFFFGFYCGLHSKNELVAFFA